MNSLLHRFCLGRPCRVIPSGGKPYMVRVYLASWRGWRLYLHRYDGEDGKRWLHNHPFHGGSIILCGWYDEAVLRTLGAVERIRRRRWWNWIPDHRMHRIIRIRPGTWTLFLNGPHKHDWGFFERIPETNNWLFHNPFDQAESGGARWWEEPDCLTYPPPEV